jgi:signal transduction histidine kinase
LVHPRNSLLAALVVTTALITAVLSWAGWRLLVQQRAIDQQRAADQLGATAERMAAEIRGKLAETSEQLSAATASAGTVLPGIGGAAVLLARSDGAVTAAAGLPFVPAVPDTTAAEAVFADAEALEFARSDLAGASTAYETLATDSEPAVRAGALLRLARVAEKRGETATALKAYRRLEQSGDVRVKHLPARFIALYQQRAIAGARGDRNRERALATELTRGLDAGDWLLTRGVATFYRDELGLVDPSAAWPLAEAVEQVWQSQGPALPARGQRVVGTASRSVLVMWRASGSTIAMMAAFADGFLPAGPREVTWHLADPAGKRIAGARSVPPGAISPRVVGDSEYAWMLHVGSAGPAAAVRTSERTLIAMVAAMLVFLWGAMYVMARAIRREAAVARLQSDFVAAVSHEFRSPLTTIRQMAEMLEMNRVTSDERRHAYYGVLRGEASRLQRLVETLLNFGRMEAGAARYRLEERDLAALVQGVIHEMQPAAREAGKRIVANGPDGVVVQADANALALAIRNLVDNAVKYSPGESDIRVEWGEDAGRARVQVIDRGIGVPHVEQQTIFEKFVRGQSAIDSNVAGTGVGLAMVRQILRAHGGDVEVESQSGRGSTFTLVLPLSGSQLPIPDTDEAVVGS